MANAERHIALVCPGGPIGRGLADDVTAVAAAHCGERAALNFHPQCFLEAGHFAGSDEERGAAFLEVANDPQYDAVWFARGGYGACRLDDSIFAKLNAAARRKTYLGYSDAGFLLARLYKERIGRPVHGPMPSDLPREYGEAAIHRALDFLVDGSAAGLEPTAAAGENVAAFNITVIAHLAASDWMPDLSDHIVMLEDVSEYLYATDRNMFAIVSDPGVKRANGLMLGRLSDIRENDQPFGQSEEEIVRYWCARAGVPYLGRADIGHDAANKIAPFGGAPAA